MISAAMCVLHQVSYASTVSFFHKMYSINTHKGAYTNKECLYIIQASLCILHIGPMGIVWVRLTQKTNMNCTAPFMLIAHISVKCATL